MRKANSACLLVLAFPILLLLYRFLLTINVFSNNNFFTFMHLKRLLGIKNIKSYTDVMDVTEKLVLEKKSQ